MTTRFTKSPSPSYPVNPSEASAGCRTISTEQGTANRFVYRKQVEQKLEAKNVPHQTRRAVGTGMATTTEEGAL